MADLHGLRVLTARLRVEPEIEPRRLDHHPLAAHMTDPDLVGYVEHFRARVLQDALNEATVSYWLRRARDISKALPRPGDFMGISTSQLEHDAREARIRLILLNIAQHVQLLREQQGGEISDEVYAALAEVA